MTSALFLIFMVVTGYLCGSICSAILVSRLFDLPDPRLEGSQNPGATNVLRLAGKKYASIVLITDMLKGFLPVLLGHLFNASPVLLAFICLAAVLGHMYPVFFGFKGGKGVATALGAMLGLNFILGAILIGLWLLIANFTRYSSLASIITLVFAPLLSIIFLKNSTAFIPLLFITFLILYKHRHNITRLMDREEPTIHFSKTHHLSDVTDELVADGEILEDEEKHEVPEEQLIVTPKERPKKPQKAEKPQKVAVKKTAPEKKKPLSVKRTSTTKKAATSSVKKKDKPS